MDHTEEVDMDYDKEQSERSLKFCKDVAAGEILTAFSPAHRRMLKTVLEDYRKLQLQKEVDDKLFFDLVEENKSLHLEITGKATVESNFRMIQDARKSDAIALENEQKIRKELTETLDLVAKHCVCDRNVIGFDYHEMHPKLGVPGSGKRWLTPLDLVNAARIRLKKTWGRE